MAVNLRNKPIDKRYLSPDERQAVSSSRAQALAKTKARRGQAAYEYSRPKNTSQRYKGQNAFAPGIAIQQQRMKEISYDKQRAESLRPEGVTTPDIYR